MIKIYIIYYVKEILYVFWILDKKINFYNKSLDNHFKLILIS